MTDNFGFIHEFIRGTSPRTLLLLHGTGADEQNVLPIGRALDSAANLLSPRGKVSENGALRFFRRHAEGVFDLEDLKFRTDELAKFIAEAATYYNLERDQIVTVGYSNGATTAASLLLQHPGFLRRAILFRGMVPFVPEPLPNLALTGVFLAAGAHDTLVAPEQTKRLADLLRTCAADVTLATIDSDHGLTMEDITEAQAWLARHG